MSSKVKCTCGWSWDKSDSSKKDVYVCHHCGKDNTMINGGWLSKYSSPEAQNGIEASMDGLTDQGFNYNGAWGGTMAMGGSLPGSVGFTYARTQNPAPSNGKYAKKTKASAQNGKEMKFWQEGLDWKPKSISEDGSVIEDDRGQWAHPGEITKINSNQITMQGVNYPVLGVSDTGDTQMMYPNQEYQFNGDSVTEIPMMQGGGKTSLRSLMNDDDLKSKSDATKVVPKLIRSTTEGEGDNSILKAIRQYLYKTVQPADYADAEGNIKPIVKGILKNKNRFATEEKEQKYRKLSDELSVANSVNDIEKILTLLPQLEELDNKNVGGIDDPYSEAGWKKYLGLTDPKKDTVFTKSNYSPSEAEEKNITYYSLPKAFEKDLLEVYYTNTNNGKNKLESTAFNESEFPSVFAEGKSRARVLGNFKIDEGEDDKGKYVSYYDKYDLSPKLPLLGDTSIDFLGKPFEIYNRIYLNNNTGKKENGGWLSKYN